jgi:hypothetical protein
VDVALGRRLLPLHLLAAGGLGGELEVLDDVSGACATTRPLSSKPLRPARPAIWWKSRALEDAHLLAVELAQLVKRTVRMGMLMPMPRVSVPLMTLSRPCCASRSVSRRYLGRMPAWCTPTPWRRYLCTSLP